MSFDVNMHGNRHDTHEYKVTTEFFGSTDDAGHTEMDFALLRIAAKGDGEVKVFMRSVDTVDRLIFELENLRREILGNTEQ